MTDERYLGDGVYASLDPARMIVLRTNRGMTIGPSRDHWIALEPEVLTELMRFAFDIGWGDLILSIAHKHAVSDEEYARDEEDKERVRASKEGFPDE